MNFEHDVPFLEQHGLQFVLDAIAIVLCCGVYAVELPIEEVELIAVKGNDIDDCEETKP